MKRNSYRKYIRVAPMTRIIQDYTDLRSSQGAEDMLGKQLEKFAIKIVNRAATLARMEGKKTIKARHIEIAVELLE